MDFKCFLPCMSMLNIFTLHFVLSISALYGGWYDPMYMIYNPLFIIFLFHCVNENPTVTSLNLAIRINLALIIFDSDILFHVYTDYHIHYWEDYFGIACGILNLISRFITTPMMIKICSNISKKSDGTDSKNDSWNRSSLDDPKKEAVFYPVHENLSKNLPPYQA